MVSQAIDLDDADGIDRLHRFGRFTHQIREYLEQRDLGLERNLIGREDVGRFVDRALASGFYFKADTIRLSAQLGRFGLALGSQAHGFGAVGSGLLFRLGFNTDLDGGAFRFPRCVDKLDPLGAFSDFCRAGRLHLLFGGNGLCAGFIGFGLGLAFLPALVLNSDLLFLAGKFERLFLGDAGLFDGAISLDLLAVNELLGLDPRLFRFLLTQRLFARDFSRLFRAAHFNFAFLLEPRKFGVTRNDHRLTLGLEILRLDLDAGFLLDVVAGLLAQFDLLGQLGETLGIKGIIGVEMLDRGLVETGERHALQLQAVHGEIDRRNLLHFLDKFAALFMQLVHRHARRHGAQGVDKFALDQFLERFGIHGAHAERLGSDRDGLRVRLHADVKFRLHVDAQPIQRDERIGIFPLDRQAHRVHVDRHGFMKDRQHQRAAIHHHLLTAKAGAHEPDFF